MRDVRVFGIEGLPLFFTGIRGTVTITDYVAERCLDTGFTFNESVIFHGNHVRFSADNGVSLSRGNGSVVCIANHFSDSFYYGVWVAGFEGDAGPTNVVVTGNAIGRSHLGGVTARASAARGVIANNVIDTVYRAANGDGGTGIQLGGTTATGAWSTDLVVRDNLIVDANRGGIVLGPLMRNVSIEGNMIIRPGIASDFTGVPIEADAVNQNYGVLVTGGSGNDWANIFITGNTFIDDRDTPVANYGVYVTAAASNRVKNHSNRWVGLRQPDTTTTNLGPRGALVGEGTRADVRLTLNAASDGAIYQVFQSAGLSAYRIAKVSDTELEVATYPTIGGNAVRSFVVDRATAQLQFSRPPRLTTYTTANRPSAATFGRGAMIYDTTLGKPLWSNGSAWHDASGNFV